MVFGVYAIKDFRNGFTNPTFESNDATAMRNFANACLVEHSLLNNFSEDFELWQIGTYDNETGILTTGTPEIYKPICRATDFVKRKVNNEK